MELTTTIKFLVLLAFSPPLALIVHIFVSRLVTPLRPDISRQSLCAGSILLGNIPMALLLWSLVIGDMAGAELLLVILYALIVYNSLGYCYFHLYNMSETARRIRLLFEINEAGSLILKDIERLYETKDLKMVRIDRLLSMGQIEKRSGRYVLKGRLLYCTAKVVAFWAFLLGLHFLDDYTGRGKS